MYEDDAVELTPGQLVRIEDELIPADSNSSGLVSGLVVDKNTIVTSGPLTLDDWSALAGTVDLEKSRNYFLNGTTMSLIPPTTGYVIKLGHALSAKTFLFRIENSVRL